MGNEDLLIFEEYFYRDLEKGFSADIACCDQCYDEFIAMWPHAYNADDCDFQTQGIDLDTFYSGSYLRDQYSKSEFDHFIQQIECPRCGSSLKWNIWVYNLPFNIPTNFEETIIEVSKLAQSTPFLLLENAFCQSVLSAIRDLSKMIMPTPIKGSLFRARSIKSGNLTKGIETFDFPPVQCVQEGRYNHAGNSVLYLGSDKETCFAEMRNSPCLILEFELDYPLRILDLTDPFNTHEQHADLLNSLVYSALVSAKQSDDGWHKPHYIVSRYVADCARSAGFDAIKYPSTRRDKKNFNLVLVNNTITLTKYARVITYCKLNGK